MGKHVFAHASSCSTGKRMFAHVGGLRCTIGETVFGCSIRLFLCERNCLAPLLGNCWILVACEHLHFLGSVVEFKHLGVVDGHRPVSVLHRHAFLHLLRSSRVTQCWLRLTGCFACTCLSDRFKEVSPNLCCLLLVNCSTQPDLSKDSSSFSSTQPLFSLPCCSSSTKPIVSDLSTALPLASTLLLRPLIWPMHSPSLALGSGVLVPGHGACPPPRPRRRPPPRPPPRDSSCSSSSISSSSQPVLAIPSNPSSSSSGST